MRKIKWDEVGKRLYETGVDHGVLYPAVKASYPKGVAWDGLINVNESPSGAESTPQYADNIEYLNLISAEKFAATIEAYFSPVEFDECDGSAEVAPGVNIGQQTRKMFGLSYRTLIGNDVDDTDHGYKIHLVYNGKAAPSERARSTVNESPEALQLSWSVSTTAVVINMINPKTGKVYKPTAHLQIDSTRVNPEKLAAFEEILYGKDGEFAATTDTDFSSGKKYYELVDGEYAETSDTAFDSAKTYYEATAEPVEARLPLPDEVIRFFNEAG